MRTDTKFHSTVAHYMARGAEFLGLAHFGTIALLDNRGAHLFVKRQSDGCVTVLYDWEVHLLGGIDCKHALSNLN